MRALEALVSRVKLLNGSVVSSGQPIENTRTLLEDLEQLRRDVRLIEEEAFSEGDYRLALACVWESWHLIELVAKLRGGIWTHKAQPMFCNCTSMLTPLKKNRRNLFVATGKTQCRRIICKRSCC